MASDQDGPTTVAVDGHRLSLTHLDKVLYPATGTTKGEVIGYYSAIAEYLLPHTAGRPATRKRWPDGVDAEPFFQKNLDAGTPAWMHRGGIEHSKKLMMYPIVDRAAALVWIGQTASLEIHVPQWRFAIDGTKSHPDRMVFDLDPGDGVGLDGCVEVALAVRDILSDIGFDTYPVTSGAKGLHLYVPLDGSRSSTAISTFAKELARTVEASMPHLVVHRMAKNLRPGKVLIDWSQNNAAKTTIAPYSMRGRELPTVAAPRTWEELTAPGLQQLSFEAVLDRARKLGDLLAGLEGGGQHADRSGTDMGTDVSGTSSGPGASGRSGGTGTSGGSEGTSGPTGTDVALSTGTPSPSAPPNHRADPAEVNRRLAVYRQKRDAAKTPEPVPSADADPAVGTGDLFVIGEHHATALHWDLRLERDGVLVSWALPKGPPSSSKTNRLAVQTEDHPMEYADFSGRIPRGEYGAGYAFPFDRGRYELLKWRDDEIMVEFFGSRITGQFVLIRTGGKSWLMHRMRGQPDLPPVEARTPPPENAPVVAPESPQPMLASATTSTSLPADEEWTLEAKWDGVRALDTVRDGVLTLRSRNDNDFTAGYPELTELIELSRGHDVVIDGEIVALADNGAPSFPLLQHRIHLTRPDQVRAAARKVPVLFYAFDLLELDGVSLLRKRYRDRRALLEALSIDGAVCTTPAQIPGSLTEALDWSRRHHLEGVVAKRSDSEYQSGQRSAAWLKFKHQRHREVIIGGWRDGQGNRAGTIGGLLLGVPGPEGLRYAGRVGSGFTVSMLDSLLTRLREIDRPAPPFADTVPRVDATGAHWVEPLLVGEVSYAEWTPDGRLRQAVWRGLRPDKFADDVEPPPIG